MGWPYALVKDPSEEFVALRRQTLDSYGRIAHLSSLAPLILATAVRLLIHAARCFGRHQRSDPVKTERTLRDAGVNRLAWWLGGDIVIFGTPWGQRDEWALGLAWTSWLLFLSVRGTGSDLVHLTRRFGLNAMAQLPVHYLLSLKDLNPFSWSFNSSHERVNRYHRLLGRIIYSFAVVHFLLYNTVFLLNGNWIAKLAVPVILLGHFSAIAFHFLFGTSLARVRRYSYRLFFVTHVLVALGVPLLVFFHAKPARLYMVEALAIFLIDLVSRRTATIVASSTLEVVPGTDLVTVSVPLPQGRADEYRSRPGSHVYLSVPSKSPLFEFLLNPFTVASVDRDDGSITLVARKRNGPMTRALADFASNRSRDEVQLAVLGPYGEAGKHFQDLLRFSPSQILLIAGGIGATFTVPLYSALRADLPSAKIQFIWAVRHQQDAMWAFGPSSSSLLPNTDMNQHGKEHPDQDTETYENDKTHANQGTPQSSLLDNDPQIQLYLTRTPTLNEPTKRPSIQNIIKDTFQASGRVAVLVCGPSAMAAEARRCVGPWVMQGREVWWHNETFGW